MEGDAEDNDRMRMLMMVRMMRMVMGRMERMIVASGVMCGEDYGKRRMMVIVR